ncbi:hypothetical protein [Desulfopila aestuarii]|uniref:Uncharacterized protein n=1 Tax=Desulfopila aestuarii DSM 18488 TaxID=1121416 RepID=A0A1M7YK48_9BACT|nr:hypothetical protein [Desulfopila aestuarii]SHO52977.1 hypothetical protein SAMN02745220_04866 [Desulfopila aestuarii DSM 18488]
MFYVVKTTILDSFFSNPESIPPSFLRESERIMYEICTKVPKPSTERRLYFEHGWCTKSYKWLAHVCGEYPTLQEARAAIIKKLGYDIRLVITQEDTGKDRDVVEIIKIGKYVPLDFDDIFSWSEDIRSRISAETTDDELTAFVEEFEEMVNEHGYTAGNKDDLFCMLETCRQKVPDSWEEILADPK